MSLLFVCPNLSQPLPQHFRKSVFDITRDESCFVEIFEMRLVSQPKADELHPNQIRQRNDPNLTNCAAGSHFRCGLRILLSYLLTRKNEMDCPARCGRAGLDQHVNSCGMAVLQSQRFHGLRDLSQILTPDQDVDIFRQTPGIRLLLFDIEISRKATHHAILESGGRKCLFNAAGEFEELFHARLEKCIDENLHCPLIELSHLLALTHGAQIDSERLALLIQMTALQAERLSRVRHSLVIALQLRQNLFTLE